MDAAPIDYTYTDEPHERPSRLLRYLLHVLAIPAHEPLMTLTLAFEVFAISVLFTDHVGNII